MPRKPLYNRLPNVMHRLDEDAVLKRFMEVLDSGFDGAHGRASDLLDVRSVDEIPDRWLPLLGDLVGHVWQSGKGYPGNRRRIRDAIRRWSYKGSTEAAGDLVRECGGEWFEIVDMASKIAIWSRQHRWNEDDSHYLDADQYHWGIFVLRVTDDVDQAALAAGIEEMARRAGEEWRIEVVRGHLAYIEMAPLFERLILLGDTNISSPVWHETLFWNFQGQVPVERIADAVIWRGSTNRSDNVWGEDYYWNYQGQVPVERIADPVIWRGSTNIGQIGVWGESIFWNFEGQPSVSLEVFLSGAGATAGGYLQADGVVRVDQEDITVDMGTPENPLPVDVAVIQEPVERVVEG